MCKLIATYDVDQYDAALEQIYQALSQLQRYALVDKIEWVSQQFLGKPYLVGALGEGPEGRFDQSPFYRTDYFDCLTLVNTVLALAISQDLAEFRRNLSRINYYDGDTRYEKRFHFMTVDWNPQNAKWGLLRDMTSQVIDEKGNTIFQMASAMIDRPNWFLHRTLDDIKLLEKISAAEAEKRLQELKACAKNVSAEVGEIPYLPLEKVFDEKVLAQIPHGAIVEIVRPAWDLRAKIGTYLNVSHLGFVFRVNNELIFRHASLNDKVLDIPLIKYIREVCLPNPTIKGINIQVVSY